MFQVVDPHLHKNVSSTTNISYSWSIFTTRSIAEKQITGNKKNFLKSVSDVLETWEGQNIFSVKWQKRLFLIKKAEIKQKKRVRTMKICKTCKNHQDSVTYTWRAYNRKKGICYIYYLWVTVITPDICQIWQENLMGNWKWYWFIWRNNQFKFEASIRQNYVTRQKWMEISHCSGKITFFFGHFGM